MCRACQREQTARHGYSAQPIRLERAKNPLADQRLHQKRMSLDNQDTDTAGAVAGAELQHAELGVLGLGIRISAAG